MLEEKLLVWQFNRGNRDVLHAIYDKYKHDLITLAGALLGDVGAAEDVVHDVFVAFIESRGRFRLTGSLKGYLSTCVANRARNTNRTKRNRQTIHLDDAISLQDPADGPTVSVALDEQLQQLSRSLGQVPYQQREVILLHLHGGLKFRQIAKLQGVSINTVQGRYRYGLDKLRSLVGRKSGEA